MKPAKPYLLMLEDDDDDRLITKTFFAANGYDIDLEFLTESEGVIPFLETCLARKHPLPCLIILDKNVPAGGGMEVLKTVKSHPVFKIVPVVMISGSAFQDEVNESYRLGVNSFIAKPFSNDLTAKRIENFLAYWFGSVELPSVSGVSPVVLRV